MLVGREAELDRIDAMLAGARAGDGGVLVLTGEPGVGKSALLDAVAARARGMRFLRADGAEHGGGDGEALDRLVGHRQRAT